MSRFDREPVADEGPKNAPLRIHEDAEATERRKDAARARLREEIAASVPELGEEETRRVCEEALKKKRGAKKGPRKPDTDHDLFVTYCERLVADPDSVRRLPRILSTDLHKTKPLTYGNSATAIEKKLRRLIKRPDWLF